MTFRNPGFGSPALLLPAIMVVAFLSLGFVFLLTDLFIERVPAPNRYFVGGVLILWSVLRAWLAWEKEKRRRQEEDNEEHHPHNRRKRR